MRRAIKYGFFGTGLLGTSCLFAAPDQPAKPPNVVFILSDDHRADLMSCAGHPFIKTPVLDSIARNGIRFSNAFSTSPLCTPARAGFLTGRYPERTGAPRICENACSFTEFSTLFPAYLQKAGYQTGYIGKYHIGEGSVPQKGFDYWASWDWVGNPEDLTIYINGKPQATKGFADDRIAELAADFIKTKTQTNRPFFLYVGLKSPHLPYHYPERLEHAFDGDSIPPPVSYNEDWKATGKLGLIGTQINIHTFGVGIPHWKTWDNYIKHYYRSALSLDESVQTVLEALRKQGLDENTIVIYTSDQGYNNGEHALTEKHFAYESVMRIPMLFQYPRLIKGGQTNSELVLNLDIAPTILDFCGVQIPEAMNGKSWKPMLTGAQEPAKPLREDFFFALDCNDQPQFKSHTAVRTDRYKLINFERLNHWELYDLKADPGEMVNQANNPEYAETVTHLKRRLQELKKEAGWSQLDNAPVICLYALDAFPLEWDEQVRAEIFKQTPVDYSKPVVVNGKKLQWEIIRRHTMAAPMDLSPVFKGEENCTYLSILYKTAKGDPGHMQFTVSESCGLALAGYFDNRLMYENWKSSDLSGRRRKYMPDFFPYTPPVIPSGKGDILIRAVNLPDSKPSDFQATILFEKDNCDLLLQ